MVPRHSNWQRQQATRLGVMSSDWQTKNEVAREISGIHLVMKKALFVLLPLIAATASPAAMAQKEIPKAPGHDQCPLGYVNTLGTTCVSPIYYEVAPTYGKACKSGWMNIGAGYCKKKTLGIF
jgi:hypothetical protein